MKNHARLRRSCERGTTIAELLIALVILSIGILALAQLFPAGSRTQLQARLTSSADYYAQEKLEQLTGLSWSDAALTDGRHPSSGAEPLGSSGRWQRHYDVATMAAPLANCKKVTVTVQWDYLGSRSVTSTTYVRR